MKRIIITAALFALACGNVAAAQSVGFGSGWQEQKFGLFGGNNYVRRGAALDVGSDDSVSLLWTALPEPLWDSTAASWRWQVDTSVPGTDLTRKGGDDRNLSLYFVFLPEGQVGDVRSAGIRSLLNNEAARVLVYTWGGDHARGAVLGSPYLGARGRTIVLRPAGTGASSESVDLAADYRRAFGAAPVSVVGLAVSADSDDTNSSIRARIQDVRLQ